MASIIPQESLRHTSVNGVDIYTITSQQLSKPSWLPDKKPRTSRKAKHKKTDKVVLLQDLWFDTSTGKIQATPDGEYLIASGIYPPQIKVYELSQLSMKFERHLDSEIIDFKILTDDYSKLAFLCTDRSISFHAKYGKHHTLRIPRMGRDLEYDYWSCDLLCAASSPDLYRINLEQGRFLSPLTTQSSALNVVSRSKIHGLIACGGDDGVVECFDPRSKSSVGRLNVTASLGDYDTEVTAIAFDGGVDNQMAVGTNSGKVLIFDLRSSSPVRVKDHMYENPILDIKWHRHSEEPKLITTDNRVVRIWDPETGEGMTSIEPTGGKINDICVFPNTGLILLALDSRQIPSYFIPDLGAAPKWSPRLQLWDELELEGNKEAVIYDHIKFLTKEDVERLNLTSYIGTDCLRASMHGYFVKYKLYKEAKALANPFIYEEYMEQKKQEKLDKEHANRITIKRRLPKVNRDLAKEILENDPAENEKKDTDDKATRKSKKKRALGSDFVNDERFKKMFEDQDFEINKESDEYMALHKTQSLVKEHFKPVSDDEDQDSSEESPSEDESKPNKKPKLHEIKDERHADAFRNRASLAKEVNLPLGERQKSLAQRASSKHFNGVKILPGGSREISFKSRSSSKYKEDEADNNRQKREKRRGIESLKLKPVTFGSRGRGRGGSRGRGGRGGRGGHGRGRG